MIATGTGLAIAGGASLAGGVMSYLANKSAAERAEMLQNKALQEWMQINIPDPEAQKLALEQFVVQGKLSPQLEKSIKANPSEFKKIATNVGYQSAQNNALKELQNLGLNGGMRLQDRAALQDAQQDSIARERGERMALSQNMAQRGLGGSGMEFAAQLQAQQSGADRMGRSSLDVAARAEDRALQALMQSGDLATKYRSQDFDEQAQRASAQDRINQFNTQNMRDIEQRNIASMNQAQAQNLSEAQRIADANVKQNNYQQEYNKGLLQKQFNNQTQLAAGKSGQYAGLANNAMQQGQSLSNLYSNMGQGVSGAATAYANYGVQQQNHQDQMDLLDKYFKGTRK